MGLKGIPSIISPELLKLLAEMGHGDRIVLADAHFPAQSIARKSGIAIVRADGVKSIPDLLAAILKLIDLDMYEDKPVTLMGLTERDQEDGVTAHLHNWHKYTQVLGRVQCSDVQVEHADRFEFYEKAGEAYAIVITSDTGLYGNMILTKGVLPCAR